MPDMKHNIWFKFDLFLANCRVNETLKHRDVRHVYISYACYYNSIISCRDREVN